MPGERGPRGPSLRLLDANGEVLAYAIGFDGIEPMLTNETHGFMHFYFPELSKIASTSFRLAAEGAGPLPKPFIPTAIAFENDDCTGQAYALLDYGENSQAVPEVSLLFTADHVWLAKPGWYDWYDVRSWYGNSHDQVVDRCTTFVSRNRAVPVQAIPVPGYPWPSPLSLAFD